MVTLNPPITGFIVRIHTAPIPWLPGHCLLTVLHFSEPKHTAEVLWVRPDGTNTSLGHSDATRRDDSGGAVALPDGSVVLYVSEEATPGAGGDDSEVHAYLLGGKIPAMPAPLSATNIQNIAVSIVNERLRLKGTTIGQAVKFLAEEVLVEHGL
jgi:hypothetical protein